MDNERHRSQTEAHFQLTSQVHRHHRGESGDHGEELDDLGLDILLPLPLHDLKYHHVNDGSGRESCKRISTLERYSKVQ